MINPYQPIQNDDKSPDPIWHFYELFVFLLVLGLACYGLCSIMYDLGFVVYRDGVASFWFEDSLRKFLDER